MHYWDHKTAHIEKIRFYYKTLTQEKILKRSHIAASHISNLQTHCFQLTLTLRD